VGLPKTMKKPQDSSEDDKSRQVDKYWVPIVGKTLDLLACFESSSEGLTLEEVVRRTGIAHTTAFSNRAQLSPEPDAEKTDVRVCEPVYEGVSGR
jgi:hypothetical protein